MRELTDPSLIADMGQAMRLLDTLCNKPTPNITTIARPGVMDVAARVMVCMLQKRDDPVDASQIARMVMSSTLLAALDADCRRSDVEALAAALNIALAPGEADDIEAQMLDIMLETVDVVDAGGVTCCPVRSVSWCVGASLDWLATQHGATRWWPLFAQLARAMLAPARLMSNRAALTADRLATVVLLFSAGATGIDLHKLLLDSGSIPIEMRWLLVSVTHLKKDDYANARIISADMMRVVLVAHKI
jgi:hypothetical protein